ncbi:hypothetical protein [Mycoplasma simbae]|uniref:hypothetical protein n=1 Tax=Mycoplasma simbae TaxID=36744 RepID=UPI0004955472|nr:hypothetical protein [Mycoplasma simbae]
MNDTSKSILLIDFFTTANIVNIISVLALISPLIYQIVLWRGFVKKYTLFADNDIYIEHVKKQKFATLIKYLIAGAIGASMMLILFAVGELAFKANETWLNNRIGVLMALGILVLITAIGSIFMGIKYSLIKIKHEIDWDKVGEYCLKYSLEFKDKQFQIRWLDSYTREYDEKNQKDIASEWKKDVNFLSTFSKKNLSYRLLKNYLARLETFFFTQSSEPKEKILLVCSAVVNMSVDEGLYSNLDQALADLKSKIK